MKIKNAANIDPKQLRKVAILEVSFLRSKDIIPEEFDGLRVSIEREVVFSMPSPDGTRGEDIFRRVPLSKDLEINDVGFIDYSVNPLLGAVLLAVGLGDGTIRSARLMRRRGGGERGLEAEEATTQGAGSENVDPDLLVYNYPKVAFRADEKLMDLFSEEVVEEGAVDSSLDGVNPRNTFRLSDSLSASELRRRRENFFKEVNFWSLAIGGNSRISWKYISKDLLAKFLQISGDAESFKVAENLRPSRELPLVGQERLEWCYAACVQSVFGFYKYDYIQGILAHVLQIDDNNGVFTSMEHNIVDTLEAMSRNVLISKMVRVPEWVDFRDEIANKRPVIGLIGGHCRVAVGASIGELIDTSDPARKLRLLGLTLLDPYPARRGTFICWENFNSITYLAMFGARLDLITKEEIGLIERLMITAENLVDAMGWSEDSKARAIGVDRLQNMVEGTGGWVVALEAEGKPKSFVTFDEDFRFSRLLERSDGVRLLGRPLATEEILRQRQMGESVSSPELTLEPDLSLVWRATAKRFGRESRLIELPRVSTTLLREQGARRE